MTKNRFLWYRYRYGEKTISALNMRQTVLTRAKMVLTGFPYHLVHQLLCASIRTGR
ncbi:MAG: hypothetical protein AB7U72_14795 [Methanosarcina sp.]